MKSFKDNLRVVTKVAEKSFQDCCYLFRGKSIGSSLKYHGMLAENYHVTSNVTYFGVIWNKKEHTKLYWEKHSYLVPV